PLPRKHVIVKCEVPDLPAHTDSKGAVRIAVCVLSSKWHKANQGVISQSPHINLLLKDSPKIDHFLEQYPASTPEDVLPAANDFEHDAGDEGDEGIGWGDSRIKLGRGEDKNWVEPGAQKGAEEQGGEGGEDRWDALDVGIDRLGEVVGGEGGEDGWEALDTGIDHSGDGGTVGEGAMSTNGGEDRDQNFPLDPVLGGNTPAPHTTTLIEPVNPTVADPDPAAPTGQSAHANSAAHAAPAGTPAPVSVYIPPDSCCHHPPMRSPPLLPASASEPALQDPAATQASTSKPAKKKKAEAEPKLDASGQPIKSHRGHPPGSKNKPKGNKIVN
ncbi:hypothetical protein FRC10_005358, partial [Ceratobasidium sp. 414]